MRYKVIQSLLLTVSVVVSLVTEVSALPFNTDMSHTQILRSGSVARDKVKGTVPLGSAASYLEKKEDAFTLVNPVAADAVSISNGERLWSINCTPCHGFYSDDGKYTPGQVNKFMPGPDVTADMYKQKPDGFFYGTINFGGIVLMPGYGWKFSATEHWDIVNYIRKIQSNRK